jgi:hypothetical protein
MPWDIAILGRTGSRAPEQQQVTPAAPVDWDQFAADEADEYDKPPDQRWRIPGDATTTTED